MQGELTNFGGIIMYVNRIQALKIAIDAINQLPETYDNKQAIERLEGMINDCKVSGTYWTKEKVFEILNKWRDEHGRNPTVTNLMEAGMPAPTTIQKLFDMKGSAFFNIYYPRENKIIRKNKYSIKSEEEWIKDFIEQFEKIKPSSSSDYNAKREKDTPTWQTIARYLNLSSWQELIKKTGVSVQSLRIKNGLPDEPKTFYVDATCNLYTKLKDLYEKIYKVDLEFRKEEQKKIIEIQKSTPR